MLLCLHCKRLNRAGSLHCQGCNGTFGCRLCAKKKHVAAMTADFCPTCGSDKLSTPVFYLPLGFVTRLAAWALLVVIGWLVWQLAVGKIGHSPLSALPLSIARHLRVWGCVLQNVATQGVCLAVLWFIAMALLPPSITKPLGHILKMSVQVFKLCCQGMLAVGRFALAILRLLFGLVEGRRPPPT